MNQLHIDCEQIAHAGSILNSKTEAVSSIQGRLATVADRVRSCNCGQAAAIASESKSLMQQADELARYASIAVEAASAFQDTETKCAEKASSVGTTIKAGENFAANACNMGALIAVGAVSLTAQGSASIFQRFCKLLRRIKDKIGDIISPPGPGPTPPESVSPPDESNEQNTAEQPPTDVEMQKQISTLYQQCVSGWSDGDAPREISMDTYRSVVKEIANIMGIYVTVNVDHLDLDGKVGWFAPQFPNVIFLNKYLASGACDPGVFRINLSVIIHEMRHAYQFAAIKAPEEFSVDSATVEQWKYNFDSYIDLSADRTAYYGQPVEVDARNFTLGVTA